MQWFTRAYQVPWYVGKISNNPPIQLWGGPYPALQLGVGLAVFVLGVLVLTTMYTLGQALVLLPVPVAIAGVTMFALRGVRLHSGTAQLMGLYAWVTRTSTMGSSGIRQVKIRTGVRKPSFIHKPVPPVRHIDLTPGDRPWDEHPGSIRLNGLYEDGPTDETTGGK